ncbi:MAG: hypothetical protein HUJ92_06125 [Bacteroidales bacterium]|nr:hypothetical protein [Bacteroidales bacterium]
MEVTYRINTREGDELIISLSSTYPHIKDLLAPYFCDIEIIDMSIVRKNGADVIRMATLKEIADKTVNILDNSPNAILFYICDSTEKIPNIRRSRKILCQQYRDELFSKMFERYTANLDSNWIDYKIIAEVENEPQYIHIIYRKEHTDAISILKQEVLSTIEYIDNEK